MSLNRESFSAFSLTEKAEKILEQKSKGKKPKSIKTVNQLEEINHELEVHQIELELQNEELRETSISLQKAKDEYWQLFDLAPVGFLKLDQEGLIVDINSTAINLLEKKLLKILNN